MFTTQIHKNCREFYKRIYDFEKPVDEDFLNVLSRFGDVTVNRFSEVVPSAQDMFKISKGRIELSGTIGGVSIFLVIPKENPEMVDDFERELKSFLEKK